MVPDASLLHRLPVRSRPAVTRTSCPLPLPTCPLKAGQTPAWPLLITATSPSSGDGPAAECWLIACGSECVVSKVGGGGAAVQG